MPSNNLLQYNYCLKMIGTQREEGHNISITMPPTKLVSSSMQQNLLEESSAKEDMDLICRHVDRMPAKVMSNTASLSTQSQLSTVDMIPTTPEQRPPTKRLPDAAVQQAKAILGNAYAMWNNHDGKEIKHTVDDDGMNTYGH